MSRITIIAIGIILIAACRREDGGGNGAGARAVPAGEQPVTVEIPGEEQPRFFVRNLPDLDAGLANLRPSETRVVRLSAARGALLTIATCADVESGELTITTSEGAFTFFQRDKPQPISIKMPSGAVMNTFAKPTAKVRIVSRRLKRALDGSATLEFHVSFGKGQVCIGLNGFQEDGGINIESNVSQTELPSEVSGSRLIATLKVSTSSDFKGKFCGWVIPAPM